MDKTNFVSETNKTIEESKTKRGPNKKWMKLKETTVQAEVDEYRNSPELSYSYKSKNSEGTYYVYRCSLSCQKLSAKREAEKTRKREAKRARRAEEVEEEVPKEDDEEEEEEDEKKGEEEEDDEREEGDEAPTKKKASRKQLNRAQFVSNYIISEAPLLLSSTRAQMTIPVIRNRLK